MSKGFSRQEYWSVLPCPSPEDLSHPGIKPQSPALQADSSLTPFYVISMESLSLLLGYLPLTPNPLD